MNLNAIDTDELKIISTILQDGLIEVNDIKYLPSIRSFFLMITRFMWEEKIVNKVDQRIKAVLNLVLLLFFDLLYLLFFPPT